MYPICGFFFLFTLSLDWHFWELSRAADPGIVETKLLREVPSVLSQLAFKVLRLLGLLQTPERGVNSVIDAALAPEVSEMKGSTLHFIFSLFMVELFCLSIACANLHIFSFWTLFFLLFSQGLSGLYFFGGKGRTIKSSEHSYDLRLSQQLWGNSLLLLREGKITVMESGTTS